MAPFKTTNNIEKRVQGAAAFIRAFSAGPISDECFPKGKEYLK